jgi:4'-phosphopantetheinyl transferase
VLDVARTEVHVWWSEPRFDPAWLGLLDPGERVRWESYRRPEDQARFLTGTVRVRELFGIELGIDPAAVRLDRTCPDCDRPHGKIHLQDRERSDLELSVSHSGKWVLVAAYRGFPIGADVERIDRTVDRTEMARVALTPAERNAVRTAEDFITIWTRKEAILKALGEGLRKPLTSVEVSAPNEPPYARGDLDGKVFLRDLEIDDAHRAAVAILGEQPARVVRR